MDTTRDNIISLALTCERLRRLIPDRATSWSLEQIAFADLRDPGPESASAIVSAVRALVDHVYPDANPALRIDRTLHVLTENAITPPGGWSSSALAAFCNCTPAAILKRQSAATAEIRRRLSQRGITSRASLAASC